MKSNIQFPNRKSIRLNDYDYSNNGFYFVTICTYNKECLLGEINNGIMNLSKLGRIVEDNIKILSDLYEYINIEKYVVMPNHIHMIISICRECIVCIPPQENRTKMLLSKTIQVFKASVTRKFRLLEKSDKYNRHACNACPTIWQSRFYDHIIRDEKSYYETWQYIDNNILSWELDKLYYPK